MKLKEIKDNYWAVSVKRVTFIVIAPVKRYEDGIVYLSNEFMSISLIKRHDKEGLYVSLLNDSISAFFPFVKYPLNANVQDVLRREEIPLVGEVLEGNNKYRYKLAYVKLDDKERIILGYWFEDNGGAFYREFQYSPYNGWERAFS